MRKKLLLSLAPLAVGAVLALPVAPALAAGPPEVTKVEPEFGLPSGGTSVTITGTNFTGATAVAFGSTAAASFTVNSETSITAVSPAGSGNVDVTVTTPKGTSKANSGDVFRYVAHVLPPIKAFPKFFINSLKLTSTHRPIFSFGNITLHTSTLGNMTCNNEFTGAVYNETTEGTEKGLENTLGYTTLECKSEGGLCKVKNTKGEEVEGTYLTADAPPPTGTEAHETGISSLPWTGEAIEREEGKRQILTHHVVLWIVLPPPTIGKGPGCLGTEIRCEDQEGTLETEEGKIIAPHFIDGVNNGLKPSHNELTGEEGLTEKGFPITGRLFCPQISDSAFMRAAKLVWGSMGGGWELVALEGPF
jgi:hypothetical protein